MIKQRTNYGKTSLTECLYQMLTMKRKNLFNFKSKLLNLVRTKTILVRSKNRVHLGKMSEEVLLKRGKWVQVFLSKASLTPSSSTNPSTNNPKPCKAHLETKCSAQSTKNHLVLIF